jgi:hypothetical protein
MQAEAAFQPSQPDATVDWSVAASWATSLLESHPPMM